MTDSGRCWVCVRCGAALVQYGRLVAVRLHRLVFACGRCGETVLEFGSKEVERDAHQEN